uniref:Uncharacterized protein n=1 Tax=Anguilla anguilla TaxID=7936 RepID=A0A0E9VJK7_ANGAN
MTLNPRNFCPYFSSKRFKEYSVDPPLPILGPGGSANT